MKLSNQKALIETLKSAARFVWFGLLGLIAAALTTALASGALTNSTLYIGTLQVNMSIVITVIFSAVIKAIDTYIHNNDTVPIAGLAPAFLQQPTRKDVPMSNDVTELRNLLTQVQTEVEAVEQSAEKVAETTVAVVKSHLQAALTAVKAGQTTDTAAKADDGAETEDTAGTQDGEAAPAA